MLMTVLRFCGSAVRGASQCPCDRDAGVWCEEHHAAMTSDAPADFYATCLQVILLSWLILAIEGGAHWSAGPVVKTGFALLGLGSAVASILAIAALSADDPTPQAVEWFVGTVASAMIVPAILLLVIVILFKEN